MSSQPPVAGDGAVIDPNATPPPPPPPPVPTLRMRTIYKKIQGTLFLTDKTLSWTPDQAHAETVRPQQLSRVISMFTSKAGAPKTSLKLSFVDDVPAGGLTFQFSAAGTEVADRQAVMDRLIGIIAANKERIASGVDDAPPPPPPPKRKLPPPVLSTLSSPGSSRASSPKPGPSGLTPEMIELRKAVLLKNPQLKVLHKELVLGRLVSESEFWEGREHLIDQEKLLRTQQPGRSSQLLDDRFGLKQASMKGATNVGVGTGFGIAQSKKGVQSTSAGELKISVTRELQREIFEEFPIVQKIYAENVGVGEESMSEAEFWRRYFRSQLWDRHRASARAGGGAKSTAKVDKVFDKYLEDPDDEIEPRHAPSRSVDMFLDLAATEEDHGETGNGRDYTMQPGKQKATLPLIRRFNDHSNRLVSMDDDDNGPKDEAEARKRLYSEIEIDDLEGPAQDVTFQLDIQQERAQFDGKGGDTQDDLAIYIRDRSADQLRDVIFKQRRDLATWEPDPASAVRAVSAKKPTPNQRNGAAVADGTTVDGRKQAEEALRNVTDAVVSASEATAVKGTRAALI